MLFGIVMLLLALSLVAIAGAALWQGWTGSGGRGLPTDHPAEAREPASSRPAAAGNGDAPGVGGATACAPADGGAPVGDGGCSA